MSVLPTGVFDRLSQLNHLSLSDNQLIELPSGIFDRSTKLLMLDLSNNQLNNLPTLVFARLSALQYLAFGNNQINITAAGRLFETLTSLTDLDLSSNQLSKVPSEVFANCSGLRSLVLQGNKISEIPTGIFNQVTNLQYLDISRNSISSFGLQVGAFDDISGLISLRLSNNTLATLSSGIFRGLLMLVEVDLSSNQISVVSEDVFNQTKFLNVLKLSNNTIYTLPNRLFDALTRLSYLALDNNQLTSLTDGVFNRLSRLSNLRLENNKISLVSGAFTANYSFSSLQQLWLSDNLLSTIPSEIQRIPVPYLYCHNNNITYIPSSFSGWALRYSMFTFQNNPANCARILNHVTGVISGVCECAPGYYGTDYCEPVSNFVKLPPFVTKKGLQLTDARIKGGAVTLSVSAVPSNQYLTSSIFSIPFTTPNIIRNITIPTILSAFAHSTDPSQYGLMSPISIRTARTAAEQISVHIPANLVVPTDFICSLPINTLDLIVTTSSLVSPSCLLQGTMVNYSGIFFFQLQVTDKFSTESQVVSVKVSIYDCGPNVCYNGGTCIDDFNSMNNISTCLCPVKFTGQYCEFQTPDCDACLNNAICTDYGTDVDGNFTCSCVPGFVGKLCDSVLKPDCPVQNQVCKNQGTCIDDEFKFDGNFTYICVAGYTGMTCDVVLIPDCPSTSALCQNLGTCVDNGPLYDGNFTCICTEGHTGKTCDVIMSMDCPVSNNPCRQGGRCIDNEFKYDGNFTCVCPDGFIGTLCDVIVNPDCLNTNITCQQNGNCIDDSSKYDGRFTCICDEGFTGKTCDVILDLDCPSSNTVCENNGTCIDNGPRYDGNFTCLCAEGFTGKLCDVTSLTSSSTGINVANITALVAGIVGGLILAALIILYVRYRRKKLRPHDFTSMLTSLNEEIPITDNDDGPRKPREVKRENIKIVGNLGKGNFGTVDKALFKENSNFPAYLCATKQLLSTESDARASLLQEAALMAQFYHDNVVRLIGVVTIGNPVLVLMEFCEHGALLSYLKSKSNTITEENKITFAGECAEGLHYLSTRHFVHRDIAARNILLSSDLRCKISDFGMSRDTGDGTYYQGKSGAVPVRWTAIEALSQHKFSVQSDVWSYGILLYEIWTLGDQPYKGLNNNQVWVQVENGYRLPSPTDCKAEVYDLMKKCWHADLTQRPTFADAVKLFKGEEPQETKRRNQKEHPYLDLTTTPKHPYLDLIGNIDSEQEMDANGYLKPLVITGPVSPKEAQTDTSGYLMPFVMPESVQTSIESDQSGSIELSIPYLQPRPKVIDNSYDFVVDENYDTLETNIDDTLNADTSKSVLLLDFDSPIGYELAKKSDSVVDDDVNYILSVAPGVGYDLAAARLENADKTKPSLLQLAPVEHFTLPGLYQEI